MFPPEKLFPVLTEPYLRDNASCGQAGMHWSQSMQNPFSGILSSGVSFSMLYGHTSTQSPHSVHLFGLN